MVDDNRLLFDYDEDNSDSRDDSCKEATIAFRAVES